MPVQLILNVSQPNFTEENRNQPVGLCFRKTFSFLSLFVSRFLYVNCNRHLYSASTKFAQSTTLCMAISQVKTLYSSLSMLGVSHVSGSTLTNTFGEITMGP